jgi:hypothetical protein
LDLASSRVVAEIESVPRDWLLAMLSVIAALATNNGLVGPIQRDAVNELLAGDERVAALRLFDSRDRHVFIGPEGTVLAWKLALLHGAAMGGAPDPLVLGHVLLGATEFAGAHPPAGEEPDLAATLLRLAVLRTEDAGDAIAREFLLFHEYEPALPTNVRYGFRERFQKISDIEAIDYVAYALAFYAVYGQYVQARQLATVNWSAVGSQVTGRATDPRGLERFLTLVSRPAETARAELDDTRETGLTVHEVIGFRRYPLVTLATGICPIWIPWITEKVGSGPRFVVKNAISSDDEMRRFQGALGEVFEKYAFDLIRRVFHGDGASQVAFLRQGERGCDVVLFRGPVAFFVELTVTEPSQEMLWEGDTERLSDFVRTRLVGGATEKLKKLEETVDAYLEGDLEIGGLDPAGVTRVYPVLLTLTPLPQAYNAGAVVRQALRSVLPSLADGHDRVQPLQLLSIADLELLEEPLIKGEVALVDVFEKWLDLGPRSSLSDYLLRDGGLPGRLNPYLRRRWDDIMAMVLPRVHALLGLEDSVATPSTHSAD